MSKLELNLTSSRSTDAGDGKTLSLGAVMKSPPKKSKTSRLELNLTSSCSDEEEYYRMYDDDGHEIFNGVRGTPQPRRYKDWTFIYVFLFHLAMVAFPFTMAMLGAGDVISYVSFIHYYITTHHSFIELYLTLNNKYCVLPFLVGLRNTFRVCSCLRSLGNLFLCCPFHLHGNAPWPLDQGYLGHILECLLTHYDRQFF